MSETNLTDYPAMFLKNDGQGGITAVFPRLPLEFGEDGDRSLKILKEANCIARCRCSERSDRLDRSTFG